MAPLSDGARRTAGGADRSRRLRQLDWITGSDAADTPAGEEQDHAWRSWVDEVVASWAASLLSVPALATAAARAVGGTDHVGALPVSFRRLTEPAPDDRRAAMLLRHPDLLAPIAGLHHSQLLDRLAA